MDKKSAVRGSRYNSYNAFKEFPREAYRVLCKGVREFSNTRNTTDIPFVFRKK